MTTSSSPERSSIKMWGRGAGGSDPVYARAALLHDDGGRPTLDGDLLSLTFKRLKRGEGDLDIVLVTQDPAQALLLHLPSGLALAGVVAERELAPSVLPDGSRVAVVSGVTGAREQIAEGDLIIVDAERGQVIVEPEAGEFVRLQAERGHRPRVLLGAAHVPAQTQGGRIVPVWAEVRTRAEAEAAVESGADGLVVVPGGDLLPGDEEDPDAVLPRLLAVAEAVGGGDLVLAASPDLLDPLDVVRLAPRARLRWALDPDALPLPLSDLRAELAALAAEETDSLRAAAVPPLAAERTTLVPAEDLSGWDEVLLPAGVVADLSLTDTFSLPPLRARMGTDLDLLPGAVAVAVGLIVPAAEVESAKEMVRAQEY
jgi:hypothetical protein